MRKILFRFKRKDTGEWVYWDMVGRITTPAGRISKVTVEHTYEDEDCYFCCSFYENIRSTAYDVIGNIHDNPELLGGETK